MGGVGLKQKVLFGAGLNCILSVSGFSQGWGTQGWSKRLSLCFSCESREGGWLSSRFSCVAPGTGKYSLDLPRAIKNKEYAMEMRCGNVLGL